LLVFSHFANSETNNINADEFTNANGVKPFSHPINMTDPEF